MSLSMSVTTTKKLKGNLTKIERAVAKAVSQQLKLGALLVHGEAVRSIQQGPKTGIMYGKLRDIKKINFNLPGKNAALKRVHQASAPGEAPATDTGNLVKSGSVTLDPDGKSATVRFKAPYGPDLEFGTKNMAARPFLVPAFEKNKAKIKQMIKDAEKNARKANQ
jgi:HK97 gp10 family phage protein